MRKSILLSLLGVVALAMVLQTGCTVTVRGHAGVRTAPPAPKVVHYDYRPGYVWVHGHWAWNSGQWTWNRGHYVRERSGYAYVNGYWVNQGGTWRWTAGHWVRNRSGQVYVAGYWNWSGGHYVWVRGTWQRQRQGATWTRGHYRRDASGRYVYVRGSWSTTRNTRGPAVRDHRKRDTTRRSPPRENERVPTRRGGGR